MVPRGRGYGRSPGLALSDRTPIQRYHTLLLRKRLPNTPSESLDYGSSARTDLCGATGSCHPTATVVTDVAIQDLLDGSLEV